MPRKQKKYHFIYKTTNLVNGKYYVGMHSTDNLEDGYVGSGKRLWYSINKHGLNNHKVEILEFLDDRKSLAAREREIVNEELLKDPQCMNLRFGGEGGGGYSTQASARGGRKGGKKNGADNLRKMRERMKTDHALKKKFGNAVSKAKKKYFAENESWWTGRKLSVDHREKLKATFAERNHQVGESNSQFGTRWTWISNIETGETVKVKHDHTFEYPWVKGIKVKKKLEAAEIRHKVKAKEAEKQEFEKFQVLEQVVNLYNDNQSLRETAKILGISHISVRNRIKKYEILKSITILKSQGK